MTDPETKSSWLDQLPFPKHWLGYIAVKIFVMALGIYIALKWQGLL